MSHPAIETESLPGNRFPSCAHSGAKNKAPGGPQFPPLAASQVAQLSHSFLQVLTRWVTIRQIFVSLKTFSDHSFHMEPRHATARIAPEIESQCVDRLRISAALRTRNPVMLCSTGGLGCPHTQISRAEPGARFRQISNFPGEMTKQIRV